jgi:antitoxin VapB
MEAPVSLNIRDPEVHQLAREVAEATGETMTDAVRTALRERLERVRRVEEAEAQRRFEDIMEFARRWRELPVDDPRPFDEIVAYDEEGLPC